MTALFAGSIVRRKDWQLGGGLFLGRRQCVGCARAAFSWGEGRGEGEPRMAAGFFLGVAEDVFGREDSGGLRQRSPYGVAEEIGEKSRMDTNAFGGKSPPGNGNWGWLAVFFEPRMRWMARGKFSFARSRALFTVWPEAVVSERRKKARRKCIPWWEVRRVFPGGKK